MKEHNKLKWLTANLRKMEDAQRALLTDEDIKDHSMLLIQEPHCRRTNEGGVRALPQQQADWQQFIPSTSRNKKFPIRSLMYVKQHLRAQQIPVDSPDITAVELTLGEMAIVAVSIYVPHAPVRERGKRRIRRQLQLIREIKDTRPAHELILAGDFNRHDQLWGGDRVTVQEGGEIVALMRQYNLQLAIKRGTPTHSTGTAIDLILLSCGLYRTMLVCKRWETQYGADHEAFETALDIDLHDQTREPRRLFRNTNWDKVTKDLKAELDRTTLPDLTNPTPEAIEGYAETLTNIVRTHTLKHTPVSKPAPYSKRWWSLDLTLLRQAYTRTRNDAKALRDAGVRDRAKERAARDARKRFHDTMRRQRRTNWTDFLDDTDNIWKATRYLHPAEQSSFGQISGLQTAAGWKTRDEDIAEELLEQFFSQRAEASPPEDPQYPEELEWPPLTDQEIYEAAMRANPWKAPGPDELPNVTWQKLWPVVGSLIAQLMRASLDTAYIPSPWKVARILPLRKPGKPDYTVAKAYRPISLLATLGKLMEAVIAERISYLDETTGLLPKAHFGARKQRSTIDALTILTEQIHRAWKQRKVLTLVSYDVKGAYNGVNRHVLAHLLRERRIPRAVARWILCFCSDRRASIMVNGTESKIKDIEHAGLPQGSPLSPILFLFYNANLIMSRLADQKGSIAFVDDYNPWVTGPDVATNIRQIQEEVIPEVTRWSERTGATLEPDKTQMIHFTRNGLSDEERAATIQMMDQVVGSSSEVKVLGVILDQQLRFGPHAARAAKRGERAALALHRLKGLRPKASRQLFLSTVAPVMDYGAPIWWPNAAKQVAKKLNRTLKIGATAVVGMFRSGATDVAAAEAALKPNGERHREQIRRHWIKLHAKPTKHWIHRVIRRTVIKKTYRSPLETIRNTFPDIKVDDILPVAAFTKAPWDKPAQVRHHERDDDGWDEDNSGETWIYTATRRVENRFGMASWSSNRHLRMGITASDTNIPDTTHAELAIIRRCLRRADEVMTDDSHNPDRIRILSLSKTALQWIRHAATTKRPVTQDIYHHTISLRRKKIGVQFHSYPGGPRAYGHVLASERSIRVLERNHESIKSRTQDRDNISTGRPALVAIRQSWRPPEDAREKFRTASKTGRHIKELDGALPGTHTKTMYDQLNRRQATILAQLRSGYSRLNYYLHCIKVTDTNRCECGATETVRHFILECPRWAEARRQLMEDTGLQDGGELPYLLGGYRDERKDGPISKWKPCMKTVKSTIAFAETTGRLEFQRG